MYALSFFTSISTNFNNQIYHLLAIKRCYEEVIKDHVIYFKGSYFLSGLKQLWLCHKQERLDVTLGQLNFLLENLVKDMRLSLTSYTDKNRFPFMGNSGNAYMK